MATPVSSQRNIIRELTGYFVGTMTWEQAQNFLQLINAEKADIAYLYSVISNGLLFSGNISLNPTISCTFTGLLNTKGTLTYSGIVGGPFQNTETITDTNGSTAVVVSHTATTLTLSTISFAVGHSTFSGTITGGTSGATATAGVTTLNTYSASETVTDANGSTGVVLTATQSSMTLTSIVMATGHHLFSGTITGGTSGATSTTGTFSWGDQIVNLLGGNNFIQVNPIISNLTGADTPPIAKDLEIWSGAARTGTLFFSTNIGSGVDSLQKLVDASSFVSVDNGDILTPNANKYVPSTLYVTLGTVENISESVTLVVNGIVQN